MARLEKGDKAPVFTGKNQNGDSVSLLDFKGKKIILFFYPRNNTPGCTAEACNLSDNYNFWLKQGFELLGVSPDTEESHRKFIDKYALPFDLISDPEHQILEAYGAWGQKNLYGKITIGVLRTTYIIGENGIVEEVFKRVKTKEHTQQMQQRIGKNDVC